MAPWVSMSVLCRAVGKQQHEAGGSGDVGGCHGGSAGGGSAWHSTRRLVLEPPTRKCPQAGDSGKCQSWQPWLCPEALAPA